jgi:fucose permease
VIGKHPDKSNEISGLVMMAISGGAVIPLLVGWVSDISNIAMGMTIIIACMVYLGRLVYCLKKAVSIC